MLLRVFVAFCAAENTDEKKPEPPGVGGRPFSGVGVSGGSVIFANLLGPRLAADPDRARRKDTKLPVGETVTLGTAGGPESDAPLE